MSDALESWIFIVGLLTCLLLLFSLVLFPYSSPVVLKRQAVRELHPERGWKGDMAESKDGSGTVRLDQHAGETYISK